MSSQIYDEAHVAISRLIGRQYNNPLGESAFPLLRRLLGATGKPTQVLDVGCGRGQTALWWARYGARVVAFDPSVAMLKEAEMLIKGAGFLDAVSFSCADIQTFRPDGEFDLIIVHDVLCYSDDRARDLSQLATFCGPRGLLSLSDYFGDIDAAEVKAIVSAWGIQNPLSFGQYRSLFNGLPLDILLIDDTTRRYAEHWCDIRRRIDGRRTQLVEGVGSAAVERLETQIKAIEEAIESRRFGHLWSIVEKRSKEVARA